MRAEGRSAQPPLGVACGHDTRGPDACAAPSSWHATALTLVMGAHLAVVQLSYTFLLEAYLTSRTVSFFTTLGCWLVGVLIGLWPRRQTLFLPLLCVGGGSYYLAWLIIRGVPFQFRLLPCALACVTASGLLAGYFFPWSAGRFTRVKLLFLHENNGFLVGTVLSLVGLVYAGERYLALAPGLTTLLVAAAHLASRRGPEASA